MNLRFPGQYFDEQSKLYYNHNRYYNPELGRYIEPDPIGLEGGLNPYAYAVNNPIINVDPSGLDFTTGFGGLLYQSWQGITGNGWNFSSSGGAFANGYNGQGSFSNTVANIAWSAGNDFLNFGTFGLGSTAKGSLQLAARNVDDFISASKFALPEMSATIRTGAESAK